MPGCHATPFQGHLLRSAKRETTFAPSYHLVTDLGEFKPMTTVQLQTSFLRPIPGETRDVAITARILRRGKALAFGDVSISTPDGRLAAHATTTYALL